MNYIESVMRRRLRGRARSLPSRLRDGPGRTRAPIGRFEAAQRERPSAGFAPPPSSVNARAARGEHTLAQRERLAAVKTREKNITKTILRTIERTLIKWWAKRAAAPTWAAPTIRCRCRTATTARSTTSSRRWTSTRTDPVWESPLCCRKNRSAPLGTTSCSFSSASSATRSAWATFGAFPTCASKTEEVSECSVCKQHARADYRWKRYGEKKRGGRGDQCRGLGGRSRIDRPRACF